MVISMNGTVRLEGDKTEVMAEVTLILKSFYDNVKRREGEQKAMEQLAEMGRLAVMTDEEISDEVKKMLDSILN